MTEDKELIEAHAAYETAKESFERAYAELYAACDRWKSLYQKRNAELTSRVRMYQERASGKCEHGMPRRFCTAIHADEV